MPVRYEFSENLFLMNLEGSHSPQDIIDTFIAALKDPSFPEGARLLLDVRKSLVFARCPSEDVKAIARFFAQHSERVGNRCAIVATDPVHYGLSRMGATFARLRGIEVNVFLGMDGAIRWLNEFSIS